MPLQSAVPVPQVCPVHLPPVAVRAAARALRSRTRRSCLRRSRASCTCCRRSDRSRAGNRRTRSCRSSHEVIALVIAHVAPHSPQSVSVSSARLAAVGCRRRRSRRSPARSRSSGASSTQPASPSGQWWSTSHLDSPVAHTTEVACGVSSQLVAAVAAVRGGVELRFAAVADAAVAIDVRRGAALDRAAAGRAIAAGVRRARTRLSQPPQSSSVTSGCLAAVAGSLIAVAERARALADAAAAGVAAGRGVLGRVAGRAALAAIVRLRSDVSQPLPEFSSQSPQRFFAALERCTCRSRTRPSHSPARSSRRRCRSCRSSRGAPRSRHPSHRCSRPRALRIARAGIRR